jgi:dihydroorotate dehydrogenase
MPDWTYQTVFRPVLFRLGPRAGRNVALGCMGFLARLPLGKRVIQLMGHMSPDSRLAIDRHGCKFPSQVGLSCAFDSHLLATPALAEFGFGLLEIGPIVARPVAQAGKLHLDVANETILIESPAESLTAGAARQRLEHDGPFRVPVLARIEPESPEDAREMIDVLGSYVDGFVVPVERLDAVRGAVDAAKQKPLMLFAAVDANGWRDAACRERCERAARDQMISGVIVAAPTEDGALRLGKSGFVAALETVRLIRVALGPQLTVIGSVGVHSPADALDYVEAGANLVQVDSGLVFAGPGLPKRINEALLYRTLMNQPAPQSPPTRMGGESWFWAFLMGLSMLIGGVMAMSVATTRVVLPYDETMAGLTRQQLAEINDRLLLFMRHDRVTLAGTMLAVGIQYIALSWWGIRRGVHWAYVSVIVSAFAGFVLFFSFLGFGYFDPFHAFVTAILFQFLCLTMHSHIAARHGMEPPGLWNDARWKASQWGQLLFVIHGAVLIVAGSVISSVGMTTVFVHEDLEFMQTTAANLFGAHPSLVPLVAHDRATFGGMLIACGVATLLPALWGFQRGQAWLWWSLMLAGNIAYCSTMLVHWTVGYHSLAHLLPAYGGWAWLWVGGITSYWYLAARDPKLEQAWNRRCDGTGDEETDRETSGGLHGCDV